MRALILFVMLLIPAIVFAGADAGGGGMAKFKNNKYYLYDFVESGIEENAYIDWSQQATKHFNPRIAILSKLSRFPENVRLGVEKKLLEIFKKYPDAALKSTALLQEYNWFLVSEEILKTYDLGFTPIVSSTGEIQLAFRNSNKSLKAIYINEVIYDQLNTENKIGLIFHEIFYLFSHLYNKASSSEQARLMTSVVFNPGFQYLDESIFMKDFESFVPKFFVSDGNTYLTYTDYVASKEIPHSKECAELKPRILSLKERASATLKELGRLYTKALPPSANDYLFKSIAYNKQGNEIGTLYTLDKSSWGRTHIKICSISQSSNNCYLYGTFLNEPYEGYALLNEIDEMPRSFKLLANSKKKDYKDIVVPEHLFSSLRQYQAELKAIDHSNKYILYCMGNKYDYKKLLYEKLNLEQD